MGGIADRLPLGSHRVLIATPALFNPHGVARIALAGGSVDDAEAVTRRRDARGRVVAVAFRRAKLASEAVLHRDVIAATSGDPSPAADA